MVNFTMFFPVFSLNFDGLLYPVKISWSQEIITYGCEVCLHPHPLYRCCEGVCKYEHPLHECIWMLHHWSDARYAEIPSDTPHWKPVPPDRTIHCTVYALAFWSEMLFIILRCWCAVFGSSCVCIISSGLAIFSPVPSTKDASCIVPFLILIRLAMIWSLISLNTIRSFPVLDNLSRKYQIVFRSGSFSGYPRKLRNDILSRISLSIWGSERLYHCCRSNIFTMSTGS